MTRHAPRSASSSWRTGGPGRSTRFPATSRTSATAARRRERSSTRSPRTTARSAGARRSSRSRAGRSTRSRPSSATTSAATLGMRHWSPWIEEVVGEMVGRRRRRTPSASCSRRTSAALSVARYQQKVADGLDLYRGRIQLRARHRATTTSTGSWRRSRRASRTGSRAGRRSERDRVHVVFSAHSLPERVLASGIRTAAQCLETASLVAQRAGLPDERWSWSCQSAGRTPEPWAGPDLGEHLEALAGAAACGTCSACRSASSPITSSSSSTSTRRQQRVAAGARDAARAARRR